ncbi:uncharacterized protein EDB93DRAFT_1117574 [Suillus bovinus]|uniref:uncharacterized protein n=1 Tax=Suillus bovinus TaxID=48563 RepID=UPI001B85B79C|nr:uncharacterized protein EDB93DRAFT_1117574 [Suillus bovinus]KAG2159006.1 hypothetical protein EDB93DRAFT_1117574 [Suillus bovinus]
MAERRGTHVRQNTSVADSQIISQECNGQQSPNLLSSTEVGSVNKQDLETGEPRKQRFKTTLDRFLRRGKEPIGVIQSIKKIYGCSWLNVLLLLTPVAWWAHIDEHFGDNNHTVVFSLCFLTIIPHECLFDYCGEQMAFYLGKDLGDLLTITLNNAVEVTLAIMLLLQCELKLLQSTITGVILLHLLLVPGAAFLTGGARIWEQDLHPVHTQLNHTLLTVGVLALLLPASFYAAINSGTSNAILANGELSDLGSSTQSDFLNMSRGLAMMLIIIYICSRIFYHNPPGAGNTLLTHSLAPAQFKVDDEKLQKEEPDVNQWVCICFLIVNIGVMAVTSEWLVDSIEPVRNISGITSEWFGLVILPFVSFSADGVVAVGYFLQKALSRVWSRKEDPEPPSPLAKAEAIDLSIQFVLLWMPFLTLLGWWIGKPFNLLFDFFEVALLLGACFLVNFVTADSKTNWAEGFILLSFYAMMVLCTWYYRGESDISSLLLCPGQTATSS